MDAFIDWDMQWEKSFIEPLKLILNAIHWDTQKRASLDALFDWGDEEVPTDTSTEKFCPTCGERMEVKDQGVWWGCGHCQSDHDDELTESSSVV